LARKTNLRTVFPAPNHDHDRCASDGIAYAEAICAKRNERLSPMRRRVLEALLASHAPLGAYELIERLATQGRRRNAFIACVHNHDSGDPVVFLICEKCGAVGEAASGAVADTIKSASRAAGFTPKTPVIEISGICAHCRSG
jgi:Fur family zinc uptake transcriptional regulator